MLLGMGLAGIGAITIGVAVAFFSQARQAYFGRRISITLRLAGMYFSCSLFSSPILCRSRLQQGHIFSASARSIVRVSRGKSAGNGLQLDLFLVDVGVDAISTSVLSVISVALLSTALSLLLLPLR